MGAMPDALISTLAELVAIDSTSTRPNSPIIALLERRLTNLGFSCERVSYVDEAGQQKINLIATSGSGLPELALVGHTDCVPFDSTWSDALHLTERDGQLFGRGACDTKSFIACALAAAERTQGKRRHPLALILTADEELGCVGAKKLLEFNKGRARRAIVGEPTSLRPIRANKGYCLAEVEVQGREGHSAYPDTGASAIFRAAQLLTRLEAYSKHALRQEIDEAFAPAFSTLNVGMVHGGKAKNVIAGSCTFTLEWRPLPGQATDVVLRQVERIRDELRAEEPTFAATIKPLRLDRGFSTPVAAEVVQCLARLSGLPPDTVSFGTEAPQLTALGASTVVFGPGDITVAHQTGEHVPKAELFRAASMLEHAVLQFCG